ncbi:MULTISPECIES: hypothetical protein [Falsihalocynthiibacter]|uniref:NnrT protein n=2 Tax=Falsihalocynthiibacter TaxID=2854182 RepID=A0A126V0F3_9RHOB|nr:hypothetical protein [Falsihalocynthiibacter arcticus]AML51346.1 hypothetical protein RC74_08840 [Falsihalocynthiibacter arcticus]
MQSAKSTPSTEPKVWSLRTLTLVFYPFCATAAAINLFMVFLLLQALGVPAISPVTALWFGVITGPVLSWMAGKWVLRLILEASPKNA